VSSVILYDGVCGLCNRLVRFVLKRDKHDQFRFASLQSSFAANALQRHGITLHSLDTFYLLLDYESPSERLLSRNDAATEVLVKLGGIWRLWAALLRLLPRRFRDWRYNLIARTRYRIFGKYETCPLPDVKDRHRFLDHD
jgi:predicted DCC family thiol-disulfide oxidoreductase YuxK